MKQWEEVKQKVDIVDLVGSYVPLQKAGRNHRGLCPFHQEKTPSFMVSPELQIFKCFGCGVGGDVFEFIKQIEGVEFPDALKILADKAGIRLRLYKKDPQASIKERVLEINSKASQTFEFFLHKHKVGSKAKEYLLKRGLTEETIKKFNLGYAPRSWDTVGKYLVKIGYNLSDIGLAGLVVQREKGKFFDFFRGRIIIPLKDLRGQVVGFSGRVLDAKDNPKYINSSESPVFRKGEFLYGLYDSKQEIKKAKNALIVEGDFGFLTLFQLGITNVAALKGTAFTPKQLEILARYTKRLNLFLDSDEAGVQAALKSAFLAQDKGFAVKVVSPKDSKDPDDLAKEDFKAFKRLLQNPKDVYDFAIDMYKAQYDLRSGSGKREFSQKVLEILAQIKDPVERTHYVKKLGLIIETDESILLGLLGRFLSQKPLPSGVTPSISVAPAVPKTRLSKEGYFLALLFKAPLEVLKKQVHKAGKGDFVDKNNLEIFEALKSYVGRRKSEFSAASFRKKLGEGQESVFDLLYLEDLSFLGDGSDKWDEESESVLRALKQAALKRELKSLSFEIKQLERDGRSTKLAQKEFNALSGKLAVLLS
jgi:DNA primase